MPCALKQLKPIWHGKTSSRIWSFALDSGAFERLRQGNPGHHRVLTHGVTELKIDFGAGYRVYYTQRGEALIILLAGGDKSSQQADIKAAVELAKNL